MHNPFSLEDKNVLVTGASSGIGRATAIECSKMGAKVIITGRNKDRLAATFEQLSGDGHQCIVEDLSVSENVKDLVTQLPILDGIVNNAGATIKVPSQFLTTDKLDKIMKINTYAPILLITELLKTKKISKGGSIVFTGSISGPIIGYLGNCIYSTTKGAIVGYSKNLALELAPKKIRVNSICPGMINTSILSEGTITGEQLIEDEKKYPLKRYGEPEEVAYGIIYLLSDASSFVTGSNLVIDGGFTIQ